MKVYLLFKTGERSANVVDVTKAVEDTLDLAPQLPRVAIITSLMDMLDADEVITSDSEEQMLAMFDGAVIINKIEEELH